MKRKIILQILIVVLIAGYFLYHYIKSSPEKNSSLEKRELSIAILPFTNLSGKPGEEYFSDGFTDGILNDLSHLKELKVCARTSSFQFREEVVDTKETGKILGVHTILQGSFQLTGDRILISVQLTNAENGVHFWSEKFDEKLGDIFVVQDKIANAVAKKMELNLLNNEYFTTFKKTTITKEVYEFYLQGRSSLNLRTPPELKKGIDFFQQAIALTPDFALAYAGVADCYNALGYASFVSPKEAFPKALEAAQKALALDSTLAEPHAAIGFYKFYHEWDWAAAEQEFRIAIALNPNYALGYQWYSYYLTAMERYDEAKVVLEKAQDLDPLSVQVATDLGFSIYYSRDYDQAIKKLQNALQINPNFPLAHLWMGRSYQAKKMYPKAIEAYKYALKANPGWPVALAQIGNVYGVSGNKTAALSTVDTLTLLSSKIFVTAYGMALLYVGMADNDKTFIWLNKAYEERSNWLVWLKTDPRWASIQSDKRYVELVNKIGLPNSNIRN